MPWWPGHMKEGTVSVSLLFLAGHCSNFQDSPLRPGLVSRIVKVDGYFG